MLGPPVLCRTLSTPVANDKKFPANRWQYHSRSDRHSRISCWGLAVDLLATSATLRDKVATGELGFAVHHTMQDFKHNRKKSLDVVICRPSGPATGRTLLDLAKAWKLECTDEDLDFVASLPQIKEVPVGDVLVAMEAKACMTAHVKAMPRLYDELNSSHLTVHGASDSAIAVGFVLINASQDFISTDRNKHDLRLNAPVVSEHKAVWAGRVVDKMKKLPRRSGTGEVGFDALGIVGISCRNDGTSPVEHVTEAPFPPVADPFNYASMVQRVSTLLATRYPLL